MQVAKGCCGQGACRVMAPEHAVLPRMLVVVRGPRRAIATVDSDRDKSTTSMPDMNMPDINPHVNPGVRKGPVNVKLM